MTWEELQSEIRSEEEELKRLRARLRRYPPISVIERAYIHRRIPEIEEELRKKREFRYIVYEYAKYYRYLGRERWARHFEIRAQFTLPPDVDPSHAEILDRIEEMFDDVMIRGLGIRVDIGDWEIGWKVGGEEVGLARRFDPHVWAEGVDIERGYVWKYPKYPTLIRVRKVELIP